MTALLLLINALVALAMVILILLQRTDASAGGVFGGSGSNQPVVRNPLARPTAILAGIFLVNCVVLAYVGHHGTTSSSVMAEVPAETGTQSIPAPGAGVAQPVSPAAVTLPQAPLVASPTATPSPTE